MPLKVFADTNIIIDFIEQRPFDIGNVNSLFESAENKVLSVLISESVITNALYVTGLNAQITQLLNIVNVICIDEDTLRNAMNSSFKDKEDGILYYGAFKSKADYFLTRNKKDFYNYSLKQLPVVTPKELTDKLSV